VEHLSLEIAVSGSLDALMDHCMNSLHTIHVTQVIAARLSAATDLLTPAQPIWHRGKQMDHSGLVVDIKAEPLSCLEWEANGEWRKEECMK